MSRLLAGVFMAAAQQMGNAHTPVNSKCFDPVLNQTARKDEDPNLNVMRARESKIPKDRGRASRAKTSKEIERDPSKGNPREPRETKYLH